MENLVFRLVVLEEASDYLEKLSFQAQSKIYYNIRKVQEGIKDAELFKKLEKTEIWEFRTLYQGTAYRLFAFWDKEEEVLVVATHGLIKKTQKTPAKEIAKAEEIRRRYFELKKQAK